jgi:hypothetical protein
MAGYLTHLMVLIKAEEWLGELIAGLERRRSTAGACPSDVEEALLSLARTAHSLLRVDPAAAQRLPATEIENRVGTGLSKYALVGSIGMDFPINGYVFALNRDWVSRTMRLGAPRRAYVDSGSTDFVLNFIKALNDTSVGLTPEQQRAMRSYALGHLAGVAADVVLQPAINSWTWATENTGNKDQHHFKVQLDARVAYGFFQRPNLHRGQPWEDYFLGNGEVRNENEKLAKVFVKAFTDTYGGTRPTEAICAGSTCRAPEVTEAFINDGYANTKGWAIGVGYDQSPWYWYKWMLGVFILTGGVVNVALIWSSTSTYNIASWRTGDGFKTERLWYDMISNANAFAGVIYYPFTWLAKFPAFWDGIFGQGTIGATERPGGKAFVSIFKGILDVLSFLFDRTMNIASAADPGGAFFTNVDPVIQEPYVRWPRFGVGLGLELLKTFWIDMESLEDGEEGDRLGFTMFWPVKAMTFGTFFISNLITFGAKSARKNADGVTTEDQTNGADYGIGIICPALFVLGMWISGFFEDYVLEKVAGARWPDTATGDVDRYLPVAENGHRSFTATDATAFPVRLFNSENEGVVTTNNREHYAEAAAASPWASVRQRDDATRKEKSQPSNHTDYKMSELIDHAAHLAGLLAIAAVNYDASGPRLRDSVKDIFKDWNLDYRTIGEWDALMKEPSATDRGLLTAVAQWSDDLKNNRPVTDPQVLARIEQEMAVTGLSGKILADFTHTRTSPSSVVSPLPPDARCGRLRRPGVIVLPNLNFDQTIATPLATPLPDRATRLDALANNTIDTVSDGMDLTNFRVERPTRSGATGPELQLSVHAQDASRIRIFEAHPTDQAPAWPRRMGANAGGASDASYTIPAASTGDLDFWVEGLSLAGDPLLPAPTVAAPVGRDGVTPVLPNRKPSDIWVELLHRDGGTELRNLRDTTLFTITPWLMFSNLQPTDRLYIVYIKDFLDRDNVVHSNHSTITDLVEAMVAVFGAAEVPFQTRPVTGGGIEYVPHQPLPIGDANAAQKLYIIDGSEYCNDQWVQDEIEIGYCWAPHGWTPMTIHVPRKRGLAGFVQKELPGADMALFSSLNKQRDSINYGGNLEVSPPVMSATGTIAGGPDGLPIPAQPIARFGKLLLGEGLVPLVPTLDVGIAGDLDAGGVISAAVRTELIAKGLGVVVTDIVVTTPGSEWRIGFVGAGAPPGHPVHVRLESGALNVYAFNPVGADVLLFPIDVSLVADLDLGGAPTERLQEVFLRGPDPVIRDIVVIVTGSEWLLRLEGPTAVVPALNIRLESGRLNVYVGLGGSDLVFILENDAALIADLNLGGAGTDRIRRAFRLLFCKARPIPIPLPVPRITTLTAGSEWLLTVSGIPPVERVFLIRRDASGLALFDARIAQPAFRNFLETQAVQPILSFDTSWLHVGHVDEVAIFVPSSAPKGYKLLMSSTQLATAILTEANRPGVGPVTQLFRGKKRLRILPGEHWTEDPANITVAALLTSHQAANDTLQTERLTPIETRLRAGLALDADDVVHLPIYFDLPNIPPGGLFTTGRTSAHFPHPINLQVIPRLNNAGQLERHVIVNRPFGPRMRPADAVSVLTAAHVSGVTVSRLSPMVGHWHWARRGTRLGGADGIAATFGLSEASIRNHANNNNKFTSAFAVKNNWDRIWIPEDNVDLFEACTQILLEDIGLTVHWIDDWETYHRQFGEIHCGTNVVRTPPEAASGYTGPYWWDHYNP